MSAKVVEPLNHATRARYSVIFFAISLAVITYIHRVCISKAAPEIQQDLGLTKVQMGFVFSAFILSYSLFEIPGGWLSDHLGPRRILSGAVLLWSFFTAATGWVWGLGSLIVCRFLFGMGQATCFPSLTKVFTIWLPSSERVRAQGVMWLFARWGGAFTPLLVFWTLTFLTWRGAFVLFGLIGIIWTIVFFLWFRDDPRSHSAVNAEEMELLAQASENASGHGNVPWIKVVKSRTVWLLWLQYFCLAYAWYFYITWLPTYLDEERGVSKENSPLLRFLESIELFRFLDTEELVNAILSGFPLFFGGIGCITGSLLLRYLERRFDDRFNTRRWLAFGGIATAALMLVLFTKIQNPTLAMVVMGLASFSGDLSMPVAWGACMDVGGKYAGSLSGSMNMMGNLGGVFGPVFVALILKHSNENWIITFWVSAVIYIIGAFCWLLIDPVTPLESDSKQEE